MGKVGIWTHHRRWHAANGPLSGFATSVPTPNADGCGWRSTGDSLWVYRHGNHGTRARCWWFSGQPSFITNSSSAPSRPDHLWNDSVGPSGTKHFMRCCLPRSPHGLAWHLSSSGSMALEDAVDGCTSQTNATSYSTVLQALMGKCKHFMPNTYRSWTGHY